MLRTRPTTIHLAAVAAAGLLVAVIAGSALAATEGAPERAQIFKWVDEHGIAHYTTDAKRIPSGIRQRIKSLGPTPPVSAAPTPRPAPELVGPPPRTPEHPESWVSRNAKPRPNAGDFEALEEAERSEELGTIDAEIAGLEGEIALREERLLVLLDSDAGDALSDNPAFRELAEELPTLQADLEVLQGRRDELSATP